ncbi:MAG TPA: rhomboid family intramembrane serine protease [Salinivirgaceae bacterium]|nr:rhomboid family intramembrane serine protease [Salinivirgaceae bacterium]
MILTIIIITFIVSWLGFNDPVFMARYQFNAYRIIRNREWHRLLTHGFLHANWLHLLINMLVLFSFGEFLVSIFASVFLFMNPKLLFLLFYLLAIAFSSLNSLRKHKSNYYYNAVGASGGVSAVVFASIFFVPYQKILFFGIIPIPGILFAIAYLAYSYYMDKQGNDNIGHDVHFHGAVFGFLFPLILRPELLLYFIQQLLNP